MQDLYSLIQNLTSAEWSSFHNYLTCFSTYNPSDLKQLSLATMLRNANGCPEADACCIKLYGRKRDRNFLDLKSSLKEKTFDFLLTDISSDKKQELDEADLAIIKMKKKSAQFQQLFYSKRRMPMLYALLDEIIQEAKEYEQYFILTDHLKAKKNIVSHKIGKAEYEKINEEMSYSIQCSNIYNKAEHYYYELMMSSTFSGKLDKPKILAVLKKNIAEVRTGFVFTKSPMVQYYLKHLEMDYCLLQEDYLQARSVCLELINIVRNNKSVYRRQRVGVEYDHLSQCEFYLGNFKQAVESAKEAQKLFTQYSDNYCVALEQEFYALFAMKEYGQSTKIANQMITSASRKELGEFRYSKYNYLLANTLFMQGKFEEAFDILSSPRDISKDKAGWETGARVLKIMTLIEMQKLDEASIAVLGLKKFFTRTNKVTPISQRDKTILNLLLILERAGFMFGILNGSAENHLVTLRSSDEKTRWEPFTHELIPFHEWFADKMRPGSRTQDGGKAKVPTIITTSGSKKGLVKEKVVSR